jgi:carbon-monoxide dehydrogenase medium subunit
MRSFDYLEPTTLEEACTLLERHGDEARPIAGGTSLIIWMRQHLLNPTVVVSQSPSREFATWRRSAATCAREIR